MWLIPIINMLLLVHTSILPTKQNIYAIPPPFSLLGAQDVLLSAETQCSFVPHTQIYELFSSLSFAVQKPDTFHTVNWSPRKKAAYQPNHFVCTKNKFLSGDQVTRDY